ncbi:ankyrin repeat domain-containing protein [Candidatus Mesenet endosymbiont of Phosphuga atrata]|uniref:ankyrin repeat domain-containing protein n=1 Tax=Candidatus Mesenet endosymbiont of Phosphuga atrata TaxID=3066221 RepID=UPI0030D4C98F
MADDKTDIIIPQEINEGYKYAKRIIEDNHYSINWSQVLEVLNEHIKQNSSEAPLATERYIDYLMYAACFHNDLDLVAWFINNGANVNFQEPESGNTLLHLAALNGSMKLIELLIVNGARLDHDLYDIKANSQGNTYIHLAAKRGNDQLISYVINKITFDSVGLDNLNDLLNYKNKKGNTALYLATKNGRVKCVELMLGMYYWREKESFVHRYFSMAHGLSLFLFFMAIAMASKVLYDNNYENIEATVAITLLCLVMACISCFTYCRITCQKEDDDYSLLTKDNEMVLHLAIENIQRENDQDQYYQCAQLLIEAMPNSQVNIQNKEENTALHLAAKKGLIKTVKLLLEKKANAEIMTNSKKTALHLAIENSHYDCALLLAEDINVTKRSWRLKLHKFSITIKNKYDYYIKSYIVCLKEKVQEKAQESFQVKKSWEEEVLLLAIERQSKGNSDNERWVLKRELIGQLLEMIDGSKIDKVHNHVKDYSQRRDVHDGDFVLKKFNNFFRKNEKYRDKNCSKLKKQESWNKDYALYCSNFSLAILAVFFLVERSFNFSENDIFISIQDVGTIISKIIAIISFFLAVKLYFIHKELDNLSDYQDKIKEINNLLIKKKEANTNSHIKVQDSNPYKPDHSNRCQNSNQLVLYSDAEEVCSAQQQRKNSYTFSKSELSARRPRRVVSDCQSELTPLLPLPLPVKTYRSFPNKLDKLKQAYQSIKQPFILDIKSIKELKYKKTLNRELIKNPSFNKSTERETFL